MTPKNPSAHSRSLFLYSLFLCIATWGLLFVGGMVTSTDSGLSVPDWPTTYNYNMFTFPPSMMVGGIFYEHGHRLFASLVGFLTVGAVLLFAFKEKRLWLRWTAVIALLLVIVQGLLGGLTVLYKLPMAISASHGVVAEIFFLLTGLLAFATSRWWVEAPADPAPRRFSLRPPLVRSAFLLLLLILLQIAVGAVMRHSYAGLAIPSFPLAYGQLLPPFWDFKVTVNFLHTRVGGAAIALFGALLVYRVLRLRGRHPSFRLFGWALGLLLLVQIGLGMMTVWTARMPVPTTFHLAVGALTFLASFLLLLALARFASPVLQPGAPQPR